MRATTRCLQCRTELLLIEPQPGVPVVCPGCGLTWAPSPEDLQPVPQTSTVAAVPPAPPRVQPQPRPLELEPADHGTHPLVWVALAGFLVLLLGGVGVAAWLVFAQKSETAEADPPPAPTPPPKRKPDPPPNAQPEAAFPTLSGAQVYKRLLRSTAFVVTPETRASGVLVHLDRGLVVTNFHAVRDADEIIVLFPAYDEKKQPITDIDHYVTNAEKLGVRAKVLYRKPTKDLAMLELARVRDGLRAVPFAQKPPPSGADVFSIGASGAERSRLWKLSSGRVSGRSEREIEAPWGTIAAKMLETNAGVNPGDSGGPVVNDRAELVAIVSHFDKTQREASGNIDVAEVRAVLKELAERDGWE
ncbi:MAG TPA: serine protease, partial [Gemmataceae bacterium]|nr:serine protease [Gemmataceae bacterium]